MAQEGQEKRTSGRVVVVSAPSGAGKTSITHRLLERHPDWRFSVSATTRPRRAGELDGVDYHFLNLEEFRANIEGREMVEWEEIFGNLYGTMRREVERMLADPSVRRIIFDIDVKGALSLRRAFPQDAVLVFIAPPSMQELRHRLAMRRTETEEVIARRLQRAEMEMAQRGEFDCVVVNDLIERAVEEVEQCLERCGGGQ